MNDIQFRFVLGVAGAIALVCAYWLIEFNKYNPTIW